MKATGIVRRIDDLGRVVIPKEIRRTLHLREGDALEIYLDDQNGVIFRKYTQSAESKAAIAQEWLEQNAQMMKNLGARFSIEDRIITCEIISNNSRRTGSATAAVEDTFIPAVGMVIAFCRATGRTGPEELLED